MNVQSSNIKAYYDVLLFSFAITVVLILKFESVGIMASGVSLVVLLSTILSGKIILQNIYEDMKNMDVVTYEHMLMFSIVSIVWLVVFFGALTFTAVYVPPTIEYAIQNDLSFIELIYKMADIDVVLK